MAKEENEGKLLWVDVDGWMREKKRKVNECKKWKSLDLLI
jgi:hypothetical protein